MASAIASLTVGLTPQQIRLLQGENHDVEVYACAIVFSVLAVLAVIIRVTSRNMKNVAFGIDDALIMTALVFRVSLLSVTLVHRSRWSQC